MSSLARFNNEAIFGDQVRQLGPVIRPRIVREQLPGVIGARIYQLVGTNADTRIWTLSGRLLARTARTIEHDLDEWQTRYCTGALHTFKSNTGISYRNCLLVDYRQSTEYRRAFVAGSFWHTCRVSATVEQLSP